jgi:UPF0716 protein FxsA
MLMLGRLILLFVLLPLADLWLLLALAQYTNWQTSVVLVIVSGIVGAYLAKRSSKAVWEKMRSRMGRGEFSGELLSDGAMIFFAAGLLLTPGFITDAIGLSILIPPIRKWYKGWIAKWFKLKTNFQIITPQMPDPNGPPMDDNTVDGSVVEPGPKRPSDSIDSLPQE